MLGVGTVPARDTTPVDAKEDKTKKLLKVHMGDELVPIPVKQEKILELKNFKNKNRDDIQIVRNN